jgi:hypothetical protein
VDGDQDADDEAEAQEQSEYVERRVSMTGGYLSY